MQEVHQVGEHMLPVSLIVSSHADGTHGEYFGEGDDIRHCIEESMPWVNNKQTSQFTEDLLPLYQDLSRLK